jgi:hypothetical protein
MSRKDMRTSFREDKKIQSILVTLMCLFIFSVVPGVKSHAWQKLNDGLYLGQFASKKKSKIWNHNIVILKIDPKFYAFELLSASEHDLRSRTAKQWCNEFGLVAAINASMYQSADLLKSTGYMKNYNHFNNSLINKYFGSLMVFNPIDSSFPEVQIIDRRLQKNWKTLIEKYNTVVQNYRMITNGEMKGWPQQAKRYSTAAIGMDGEDNVLFILSRPPYSTHDFINILLSLPINIKNAMYAEGGPQATLYFRIDGKELKLKGTYATESTEYDGNESVSEIPNVIGIVKRK